MRRAASWHQDGVDIPSAVALGRAMAVAICVPWLVCFAVYSMMHYTYPRDIRKLEAQERCPARAHG